VGTFRLWVAKQEYQIMLVDRDRSYFHEVSGDSKEPGDSSKGHTAAKRLGASRNNGVYVIKSSNCPIQVELQLDGKPVTMEVDTRVAVSLISEQRLNKTGPIKSSHS